MRKPQLSALPVLLLVTGGLSGCTTNLTAMPEPSSAKGPSYGIPYRLPMKHFEIAVTWEVTKCLSGGEMEGLGLRRDAAGLAYDVKAVHKGSLVEGESIVMDYRQMTNRFKTGKLEVTYWQDEETKRPLRFVKSINGTIEGKEPEALKSGIQTVANLAKTVLTFSGKIPSGASPMVDAPAQPTSCTPDTIRAIQDLATADAELKTIAEEAGAITTRLELLKARAMLGELTPADKDEHASLNAKSDKLAARVTQVTAAQKLLRDRLSYSEKFTFPGQPDATSKPVVLKPNAKKVEAWLKSLLRQDLAEILSREAAELKITASLIPVGGDSTRQQAEAIACPSTSAGAICPGYVYREPVAAQLMVTAPAASGQEVKLVDRIETVPQLGRMRILPLRSRFGEKNGLVADFSIDGTPTKISYEAIEAGGPKMAAAAQDASASALELAGLIAGNRKTDEEETAAEEKAKVESLQRQIAIMENQKKLADLQAVPEAADPESTALTAEIAVLRMKKEKAELEAAIRTANGL